VKFSNNNTEHFALNAYVPDVGRSKTAAE
jgi:hypothetical protein